MPTGVNKYLILSAIDFFLKFNKFLDSFEQRIL